MVAHTDAMVLAGVQGGDYYWVQLMLDRVSLAVACTCPYFAGEELCKHVWATILETDLLGYLSDAESRAKIKIDVDDQAVEELMELEASALFPDEDESFDLEPSVPSFTAGKVLPMQGRNEFAAREKPKKAAPPKKEPEPAWKKQLAQLTSGVRAKFSSPNDQWPLGREILYVIDAATARADGRLTLELCYREFTMKGKWSKPRSSRINVRQIPTMKDAADRQILTILSGSKEDYVYSLDYGSLPNRCGLTPELQRLVLPLVCATDRCRLRRFDKDPEMPALAWDDGESWELWLTARRDETANEYALRGVLRRGPEEAGITSPIAISDGFLITHDFRVSRLEPAGAATWLGALKQNGELRIPIDASGDLIEQLLALPGLPRLELAKELEFEQVQVEPKPKLVIRRRDGFAYNQKLRADLSFDYEGTIIPSSETREGLWDRPNRRFMTRDREAEERASARLTPLGVKFVRDYYGYDPRLEISPRNLPNIVKTLLSEGWNVEAEGKLYRKPGSFNMGVSSGIDWFELHGAVEFGDGLQATLPALLSALKRGDGMIQLGDGSFGLLPEDWMKKYGLLAALGQTEGDHLRFKHTQTGVLDALLAAQPEIKCDEVFARARAEWQNFKGIKPLDPPASFEGTLREYQREGLGWFEFLQRFGFGGCLADDMGLGKTVQVLALLEARRLAHVQERNNGTALAKRNGKSKPSATPSSKPVPPGLRTSLVVVPRSLIFNWQQEAQRFTPGLRLLTHAGIERTKGSAHFEEYDLVLTTYGTLRRDAVHFQDAEFDFVILDESQAIKNATTESAKAARLLRGKHRLGLSGTPIENHLGELWSLFEFLNPGMLGAASAFQLSGNNARTPNEETKALLSRALRPFILRRTKQQVAKDLPERLEQTIYCEMEPSQRKQYEELRDYYRAALLERVGSVGIKRAKMQILEALLRLRQAACHPALITKSPAEGPCAKLDVLVPRLGEVISEGHKALVFSQFTSFLAILRRRLSQEGIEYEYLDGKTRDRASCVDRFQNDPKCKLFLISLKAGGLGLNLTAAEYVFLLDPWWNPAVEAQAIDRAHRIGQTERVFAYRLIARDTVEEKVLALQETKRDLADAIIGADNNLLRSITRDDLMLLLS
jgi:superfamily II DNA or RNA helicase